jgi:hypothetical protein
VRADPLVELVGTSLNVALDACSSRVALRELLGVLGVDFVMVLLRLRPLPPLGNVKSAGTTLPMASAQGLVLGLAASASSAGKSRALLLSLLRSLIPFAEGSRLALTRKNVFAISD